MSFPDTNHILSFRSIRSYDIDELGVLVKPWDLEIKKLDRGSVFSGIADQVISKDFLIVKTDFSSVLDQKGAPPKGMRTFWVPVDDNQNFISRKQNIYGNRIGFFPLGAELDGISQPGFKVYVISVPEPALIRIAAKFQLDWTIVNRDAGNEYMVLDPGELNRIRHIIELIFGLKYTTYLSNNTNSKFAKLSNELIVHLVLACIKIPDLKVSNPSNRLRVFNKVIEFVYGNPNRELQNADLCDYASSSERTLQYAMKFYTGLTPNQFVKSHKLNLIQKILLKSDPDSLKINELAFSYGLWHLSQFAADYKMLFGELPSETLGRK
jgi:AraC family ethanolamine operon transcriptional activator